MFSPSVAIKLRFNTAKISMDNHLLVRDPGNILSSVSCSIEQLDRHMDIINEFDDSGSTRLVASYATMEQLEKNADSLES